MRLKVLATTGLSLSIGFSSFSYGGIASAETKGQIVAQEQQYRYDKLRKALPTIGANWINIQTDALAIRTQGALVLKEQSSLQKAHKTLQKDTSALLNNTSPSMIQLNQNIIDFVNYFEANYDLLSTLAQLNNPEDKDGLLKRIEKLNTVLDGKIQSFESIKKTVNTSAVQLEFSADTLKNEIKTVMETLDDSDSSITQLTTDIENIQKQMKISRDKLSFVAVQMAVDSLLFGAQVGIAVSQLPLINEDVEDSIINGSAILEGGKVVMPLITGITATMEKNNAVVATENANFIKSHGDLMKKLRALNTKKAEGVALQIVHGQAENVATTVALMDNSLSTYEGGLLELKDALATLKISVENNNKNEINNNLKALKTTTDSLKIVTKQHQDNYSIRIQ
ncbi:TPA: HBL/NHE enterotoxin family protein [Bacillus cereus]|nr:HBL/NHE enterotoxin family protein [Bacillus cereus]